MLNEFLGLNKNKYLALKINFLLRKAFGKPLSLVERKILPPEYKFITIFQT